MAEGKSQDWKSRPVWDNDIKMQDYCFVGVMTCHLAGRIQNLWETATSIIDSIEDEGSRFLQNNDTNYKTSQLHIIESHNSHCLMWKPQHSQHWNGSYKVWGYELNHSHIQDNGQWEALVNMVLRIVSRRSLEKGELNTINNSLTECMSDSFDLLTQ